VRTANVPEPPPSFLNRLWASLAGRGRASQASQKDKTDPNTIHFARLTDVRDETERIARLLGVRPCLGRQVLKASLLACRSPRILHLATSGYFLGGAGADGNQPTVPRRDKLLQRSGLALAGANTGLHGGSLPEAAGDGLLPTQEIAGLDLAMTELVVLPSTGAGVMELGSGPGLMALQRAFLLAGAAVVVMTLWEPPATVRRELLADFYRRFLAGQGRGDALREALRAIKTKHPDPRGWAAFVSVGDISMPRRGNE
jgi:CHAT domain-containing protein